MQRVQALGGGLRHGVGPGVQTAEFELGAKPTRYMQFVLSFNEIGQCNRDRLETLTVYERLVFQYCSSARNSRLARATLDVQLGLAGDIDSLLASSLSGMFLYTKLQAGTTPDVQLGPVGGTDSLRASSLPVLLLCTKLQAGAQNP